MSPMVSESTDTIEVPEYFGGTNSRLWIGTRSAGGTGFNGDMGEFQLYHIELNALQVQQLFESPNSVVLKSPPGPLMITGIERKTGGTEVDVTFDSAPGFSYLLEASSDLLNWEELADAIDSLGATTTVTASGINPADSRLFFRVAVEEFCPDLRRSHQTGVLTPKIKISWNTLCPYAKGLLCRAGQRP
jgi:hypothetical protein